MFKIYLSIMTRIAKSILLLTFILGSILNGFADRGVRKRAKNKVVLNITNTASFRNSLSFNLPSASQSSLSVDLLSKDTFSAPVLEEFKVPEITSEDIPFLEAQAQEAEVAKRKAQYRALEEDDLKIEVKMGSVISKTKYFVTPPPSTCEGASGPAAKLLDCTTTFPAVKLTGFGVND